MRLLPAIVYWYLFIRVGKCWAKINLLICLVLSLFYASRGAFLYIFIWNCTFWTHFGSCWFLGA